MAATDTASVHFDCHTENRLRRKGFDLCIGTFHNAGVPLKHHHPGFEIVLPHMGIADVFYGATRTKLTQGEVCLGPGSIPHGAYGNFDRTVIHFDPDLISSRLQLWLIGIEKDETALFTRLSADAIRRLLWVSRELKDVARRDTRLVGKLLSLVVTDIQIASESPRPKPREERLLQDIITYMETHLQSLETLDALAQQFSLSRSHMTSLFVKHTGHSPGRYWLQLRLRRACELIEATSATTADIASHIGFQSLRGFQRAFQRHFGMTVSAYRELTARTAEKAVDNAELERN